MGAGTQRSPLSRRTFLRVLGTASGAALASGLLGSCGSGLTASGAQVVNSHSTELSGDASILSQ